MNAREKPQPERQEGDGAMGARDLASHGGQPAHPAPAEHEQDPPPERAEFIPSAPMAKGVDDALPAPTYTKEQVDAAQAQVLRSLSNPRAKRLAAVAEEPARQLDLFSPKEQSQATPQNRRTGAAENE